MSFDHTPGCVLECFAVVYMGGGGGEREKMNEKEDHDREKSMTLWKVLC